MKGFSIGIFNLKSLVPENQYACSIRMQFSSRNRVAFFPSFFFFAAPHLFFKEWIIPGFSMKQAAVL